MRRSRRRRRTRRMITGLVAAGLIVTVGWWIWPDGEPQAAAQTRPAGLAESPKADSPGVPLAVITDPEPGELRAGRSTPKIAGNMPKSGGVHTLAAGESDEGGHTGQSEPEAPASNAALTDIGSTDQTGDEVLTPSGPTHGLAAGESDSRDLASAPEMPEPDAADSDKPKPQLDGDSSGEKLSDNARINAALQRYRAGQRLEARTELNRMLQTAADPELNRELRRHLARIADETIFSRETLDNDPLIARHPLGDGEYLIHVQNQYNVPYEMIMLINGIKDAGRVRAGQVLKVPRGPFHVVIHKSAFRLDLYLQDLYVRSFPVGLGADSSTPVGDWIVKDRLRNPTYYPSASAENKRIINADDPKNPLGEYWVGLKGIGGDALGQEGFGIHGTIDPTSVGKNASMGCVRMLDDDIRFVFSAMQVGKSKVKTVP